MPVLDKLNVGIVGAAGGRAGSRREAFEAHGARIHAVCDVQSDRLEQARRQLGADEAYTDYVRMLDRSELEAVFIATPMHLHAPQSIMALRRGIHVLCEVPAAVSIEQARELVRAASESKAVYMMAENYIYIKPNLAIRRIVREGLFGELYYAEGEYIHELKGLNERTPWRRRWQTGTGGVTYGTHSLGPILTWMEGDRVTRVCCADSAVHYADARGRKYAQQTPVMLCKTRRGALIKIRVDMLSDRPHAMHNFQLQGVDGAYETSRGGSVESGRIWLRRLSRRIEWMDFDSLLRVDDLAERFVPEPWRDPPEQLKRAGHGGGDYFTVGDFLAAIRGRPTLCDLGIHAAMDMTLPGLVSQQSILQDGAWREVPDSRNWNQEPPQTQLQMIWPERRLDCVPRPHVPDGYELRQYRNGDEAAYLALMAKAGFENWTPETLANALDKALPDGFFVIAERASGRLVATAMAMHDPSPEHPFGGVLSWVAGDSDHRGKGLGLAVCAAAVARLIKAGYRRIFLRTDDFRLAAIKTYLKLGFEPFLLEPDMAQRWQGVTNKLAEGVGR